ncbi:MAG: hypothetical protein Q9159_003681 [Coniocarpon cinnabarinum]
MTPVASTFIFSSALIAICVLTLLLLRHYLPLRSTPAYLLLPVFLSLAIPSSIILLVPIDLATNAVEDEDGIARGISLPDGFMRAMWRIAYWLTFVLTWFILPFLADFVDSGHRDPNKRVWDSVRSNLRYQLVVLGCAIAVLVYYILNNGFHAATIKGTAIALAYAWGLVLAIYLMGHGLVAIPRELFQSASTSSRLRRLQTQAPRVHEKMTDAIDEHDTLEIQVMELSRRKNGTALDFRSWIEELADTSDLPEARAARAPPARVTKATVPNVITERFLADLTRRVTRARHKRIRFIEEWDHLVREANEAQLILDASSSKKLEYGCFASHSNWHRAKLWSPTMRYYMHATVFPALRFVGSLFLGLASACIIWSEVFKRAVPAISVVGLSVVHHPKATERGKIGFAGQLMAGAWLCYMCAAALMSIKEVKVWGNRALVRRHTYAESACWYSMQVAKLTVPLSYNFITFLPKDIYTQTAYYNFLGRLINFTPLGEGFSAFFPIFILVPVAATTFNLYGRIRKIFGFGFLDDDSEENQSGFGTGGWREGRALIERERIGSSDVGLSDQGPERTRQEDGAATALAPSRYTDSPSHSGQNTPSGARSPRPRQQPVGPPPQHSHPPASRQVPEDEAEGNFFQEFAHRVRNTLDTIDKPELPKVNFSKPKWLNLGDNGDSSSGSTGRAGPLDRLFAGRNGGEVRL